MRSQNFRKLVFGVPLLTLGVVLIVVLARTFYAPSKQINFQPYPQHDLTKAFVQDYDAVEMEGRLARSIQFPTLSYFNDEAKMKAEDLDKSLQAFAGFHKFLRDTYKNVFERLSSRMVNENSLVLHWRGKNPERKPILLIAHIDVVPAPTQSTPWQEAPFSGKIDDEYIWGRGTLDDKGSIISILNTVEWLLGKDFIPERDVYLAFGHDEEIGGQDGAQEIAKSFAQEKINFEFVLDEGGALVPGQGFGLDPRIALIGTAEKGFANIIVSSSSPGGHSSMPPEQTAIGEISEAIHCFDKVGFPAKIGGAFGEMLDTLGPEMNFLYRMLMRNQWISAPLLKKVFAGKTTTNAFLRTSHSFTMINGGSAANVLPNQVDAVLNLRLLPGDTFESARNHVAGVLEDKNVKVRVEPGAKNPSRISDANHETFLHVARSIRSTFANVVVTPYLVIGGTDARHYEGVSRQIYRFLPVDMRDDLLATMHGIDERIPRSAFKQMHEFYLSLLVNLK